MSAISDLTSSPTVFDGKTMPRTLGASSFIMTVLKAQGIKGRITKITGNIEEYIEDIKEMEADGTTDSDYYFKRWEESNREFNRIEDLKTEHEELVSQLRLMCGYLVINGTEEIKRSAKASLLEIQEAENEVDKTVREFKKKNKKYLLGKNREGTTQNTNQVRNINLHLQMASKIEPEGILKKNSGLTQMREWQKQWKEWTNYLRSQGFPMTDRLYAQMLLGRCDSTMKLSLEAMDDVYNLGEKRMWERIESIYTQLNPLFLRRAKCYESKPVRGELTSEFATRFMMNYKEAEMDETTIWGHLEHRILMELDTSDADDRELKDKLAEELRMKPNPNETQWEEFVQIIKDHEARLRIRNHHQKSHKLCGEIHQYGKCSYKCKTCDKPHRENSCWIAYPEKGPKGVRENQGGRNRNTSKEIVDTTEGEFEKIIREIQETAGDKVNRVRKQLFGEEDEEEETKTSNPEKIRTHYEEKLQDRSEQKW